MPTTDSQTLPNSTSRSVHRRRYRPQTRQHLIEQFENGEQSLAEFCEENGLCRSSLWRWIVRRRREESGAGALVQIPMQESRAAETSPAAGVTPRASVRVELVGGMRLEIVAGTDPAWLAALVRALEPARA